jgi:hypothetical protein
MALPSRPDFALGTLNILKPYKEAFMKTLCLYVLGCAWCACWFCACGGAASVGDISNSQEQDQNQTNSGDIQTAQEACAYCVESQNPEDGSLSQCVTSMGFDISDC